MRARVTCYALLLAFAGFGWLVAWVAIRCVLLPLIRK